MLKVAKKLNLPVVEYKLSSLRDGFVKKTKTSALSNSGPKTELENLNFRHDAKR
jgi:hypothetical protein